VALAIGLDIGSTTTKAVLVAVTDTARVMHIARHATPSDVTELLAVARSVTRECAAVAAEPIAAIGIASMAESGAVLDRTGRALTPLLRWDGRIDRRHLRHLLAQHPDLTARTGVPATTKPAAVVLTALRAEQPDVLDAMRHWAGGADLVAHALTTVRATDHTLALRTMMAGARGEVWDEAVLGGLAVTPSVLPEIRPPGAAVGTTSAEARRFGLPAGVPVFIAGHDHAVGAWAVGARAAGSVADSLGTSEAIVRVTDAVDRTPAVASGFAVARTVDGAALTILGGSPACGAMLEWWEARHPRDGAIATLAAHAPDQWSAVEGFVLPYPSGRQCPVPDPAARVTLVDLPDDPRERARAVLQSLVLHARWMRETADLLAGSQATEVTLIGSLAERIPVWAPLTAAAAGISTRIALTAEPVAAGAAILAAARAGVAPAPALSHEQVAPARTPGLDHAYRRFLGIVDDQGES
jgi:xylulokinase